MQNRCASYFGVVVIIVWGVSVRLVSWFLFAGEHLSFAASESAVHLNYLTAIGNHLSSFLYYTHTKPPGSYMRDALSLYLFGADNLSLGNFVLTSLLDCFAAALLFSTLVFLRLPQLPALGVSALWSLVLLSWEYWRGGSHWDHFNIFFVALFAWALCRRLRERNAASDLLAGLSGGCLVLFYSAAPVLVPLLLLCTHGQPVLSRSSARSAVTVFMAPIVIIGVIVGKNGSQFGLWSTGSTAGQNMMQSIAVAGQNIPKIKAFLWSEPDESDVYGYGPALVGLREFVRRRDYPSWWVWCFDEALRRFPGESVNQFVAGLYGQCITRPDHHYDFAALAQYLVRSGEGELVQAVRQDERAARETPWLLAGAYSGHGSTTRFAVEYGKVSSRVWLDYFRSEPLSLVLQVVRSHVIFYFYGANFFGGDQYEPQLHPRPLLVRWVGYLFVPILLVGSVACYLFFAAFSLAKVLPRFATFFSQEDTCTVQVLAVFSLGVCVAALVMNSLSCCENARFFVSLSPLVLPVGVFFSWRILQRILPSGS